MPFILYMFIGRRGLCTRIRTKKIARRKKKEGNSTEGEIDLHGHHQRSWWWRRHRIRYVLWTLCHYGIAIFHYKLKLIFFPDEFIHAAVKNKILLVHALGTHTQTHTNTFSHSDIPRVVVEYMVCDPVLFSLYIQQESHQ